MEEDRVEVVRLKELSARPGSAFVRPILSLLRESQKAELAHTTVRTSLSCPLRKHLVLLELPEQSTRAH